MREDFHGCDDEDDDHRDLLGLLLVAASVPVLTILLLITVFAGSWVSFFLFVLLETVFIREIRRPWVGRAT